MRKPRKIYIGLFALLLAGSVGVGSVQAISVDDCGNGNIGYGGNCEGFNQPDDNTGQPASNTGGGSAPVSSSANAQSSQSSASSQAAVSDTQAAAASEPQQAPEANAPAAPAGTPEGAVVTTNTDDGLLDYVPGPIKVVVKLVIDLATD